MGGNPSHQLSISVPSHRADSSYDEFAIESGLCYDCDTVGSAEGTTLTQYHRLYPIFTLWILSSLMFFSFFMTREGQLDRRASAKSMAPSINCLQPREVFDFLVVESPLNPFLCLQTLYGCVWYWWCFSFASELVRLRIDFCLNYLWPSLLPTDPFRIAAQSLPAISSLASLSLRCSSWLQTAPRSLRTAQMGAAAALTISLESAEERARYAGWTAEEQESRIIPVIPTDEWIHDHYGCALTDGNCVCPASYLISAHSTNFAGIPFRVSTVFTASPKFTASFYLSITDPIVVSVTLPFCSPVLCAIFECLTPRIALLANHY